MPGLQQLLAGLEGLREFDLTEMHKVFAKVYMKIFGLYGDTIHRNDGTHLDGGIGIADDRKMQRSYTGFVFCLQCEWEYITRIVPRVAPFLAPIEDTIHRRFIPALLNVPPDFITGEFCIHLSHSVKRSGI